MLSILATTTFTHIRDSESNIQVIYCHVFHTSSSTLSQLKIITSETINIYVQIRVEMASKIKNVVHCPSGIDLQTRFAH